MIERAGFTILWEEGVDSDEGISSSGDDDVHGVDEVCFVSLDI